MALGCHPKFLAVLCRAAVDQELECSCSLPVRGQSLRGFLRKFHSQHGPWGAFQRGPIIGLVRLARLLVLSLRGAAVLLGPLQPLGCILGAAVGQRTGGPTPGWPLGREDAVLYVQAAGVAAAG